MQDDSTPLPEIDPAKFRGSSVGKRKPQKARARRKLTKRVVDALQPDASGQDVIFFDTEQKGFGVRVVPSGVKSYVLRYTNKFGRKRSFTLGRVGALTPAQARSMADDWVARIRKGEDPSEQRQADRAAQTVAELCDEYLEANKGRIKASTLLMDRSRINRHVKPLLGPRAVASLTPADMERFLRDVMAGKTAPKPGPKRALGGQTTGGAGVASRTLGMLGTILERAVRNGALAKNPVRGIERPRDNARKPPFSFERIKALGEALRAAEAEGENIVGLQAIRLLLLTGVRRSEALTAQRGVIDRAARCFRFPDTKSGAQMRAIGRSAMDFLMSIAPAEGKTTDYVFAGEGKRGFFVGLPKVWRRVSKRAGFEDVTIHGLRHWFASAATELGYSDLIIGALLGHAAKGITGRYATAPDPALLAAADRISLRLAEALDGTEDARVIPFMSIVTV